VIEVALAQDLVALLQRPNSIKASDASLRAAASDALSTVLDVLSTVQTVMRIFRPSKRRWKSCIAENKSSISSCS